MNPAKRAGGLAAVILSLLLGGCIVTPYAPYSYWLGGGYTETELQPNVFMVHFEGNTQFTPDRSADYALLRAAELCLGRGRNFLLAGELATRYVHRGYTGGETETTVTPSTDPKAPPTVVTQTSPQVETFKPSSGVTVTCVEDARGGAWDARYLAHSIRDKYSL